MFPALSCFSLWQTRAVAHVMVRCFPSHAVRYIQSQSVPSHPMFPARLLPLANVEPNLLINDWWHPSSDSARTAKFLIYNTASCEKRAPSGILLCHAVAALLSDFFLCTDAFANAVSVARRIWWTDLGGLTKPACKEELVGWMHYRTWESDALVFLHCHTCFQTYINRFVHLHLLRPRSLLISSQWGTAPANFACSMMWKGVGVVDWAGRPYATNFIVSSVLGCIWQRWPLSVKPCAFF